MADYSGIITAIDAAILEWVGEPVTLSEAGRSVTYRSLDSLIEARKYYAGLQAQSSRSGRPFGIIPIKAPGAR